MVSAFASSWPSPPEPETPRKKEESLKALKALVRDWDLLEGRRMGGGEEGIMGNYRSIRGKGKEGYVNINEGIIRK